MQRLFQPFTFSFTFCISSSILSFNFRPFSFTCSRVRSARFSTRRPAMMPIAPYANNLDAFMFLFLPPVTKLCHKPAIVIFRK